MGANTLISSRVFPQESCIISQRRGILRRMNDFCLYGCVRARLASAGGWSMMELMIVVAVIGLLAAIAVPQMTKEKDSSKNLRAQHAITTTQDNILGLYTDIRTVFPTAQGIVDDLRTKEGGQYSYDIYAAGMSQSVGPTDLSITREEADMVTTCAKSQSGLVFCMRRDMSAGLVASTPAEEPSLFANLPGASLIAPDVAHAQSAADKKTVAQSTGVDEASARAALASRFTAGTDSATAKIGWRNDLPCPDCTAGRVDDSGSGIGAGAGSGSTSTYEAAVLLDQPWGFWRLNDATAGSGSPIADISGSGRVGTFSASASVLQSGATSDGETGLLVINNGGSFPIPDPLTNFSFEYWFSSSPSQPAGSLTAFNGGGNRFTTEVAQANRFQFCATLDALCTITTGYRIADHDWHMITIVRDTVANKVRYYLDGAFKQEWTTTSNAAYTSTTAQFMTPGNPAKFDEIAIYDKVLTATQIANHYAAR